MTPQEIKKYDAAKNKVREILGSFDNISKQLYRHGCGESTTTVWRWFESRSIPLEHCIQLWSLTGGGFALFDLIPNMRKHMPLLTDCLRSENLDK